MAEKLILLVPEIILFAGAVLAAVLGLSKSRGVRESLPGLVIATLLAALVSVFVVHDGTRGSGMIEEILGAGSTRWLKASICVVGAVLALLGAGLVDRKMEADVAAGRTGFDPIRTSRGEYWAFFLLSLVGVNLCVGANDLIWLFVALELTSLPTYIMVAISRPAKRAQEAAMKYFFLGALAAAIFLYGFAMLYGAAGSIELPAMRAAFAEAKIAGEGGIGAIGTVGLVLAIIGVGYKIAAAPMHFYAADVYEGAAAPVTAFLGFVPKMAGMVALILLLGTVGWETVDAATGAVYGLPQPILTTLWMVAVLTMTLGNIGALLQRSAKRMLAYSSIAHSGYMLIGLIAGPGLGLQAVLFYLPVYGIMNTGAFAVLSGLERKGREIETLEDLAGLRQRHPAMAWAMALCAGSLLGFPPLLGFVGKLFLFAAGVEAGQVPLVVIAGLNSAISGWYYLQLVAAPILRGTNARSEAVVSGPTQWPRFAAVSAGVAMAVLPIFASALLASTGAGGAEATDVEAAITAPADDAISVAPEEAPVDPVS